MKCGENWLKILEGISGKTDTPMAPPIDDGGKRFVCRSYALGPSSKRVLPTGKAHVLNFIGYPGVISPISSVNYRADMLLLIEFQLIHLQ